MNRIKAGTYKCRAIAGSEQYGLSDKGTEQVAIELELLDGDDAGERVITFLYFTPEAAEFSIDRLRALGWTGMNPAQLAGLGTTEARVRIRYEMYNNEERMKSDVLTGTGFRFQSQMDEPRRRQFGAQWERFVVAREKAGGAPRAGAPPAQRPQPQNGAAPAARPQMAAGGYPAEWDGTGPDPADNIKW